MSKLSVLVVDDEAPARAKARRLLTERDDVEIVGEASDGEQALELIRALRPDVVLLDIQMPKRTGFEVLAALAESELPHVVFATAFDEHAIQAFDIAAVDYLLKPFDGDRLHRAVDRVMERAGSADSKASLDDVVELLAAHKVRHLERIVVESRGRRLVVDVRRVRSLRAEGNYVEVQVDGASYLCRGTLASYESRLDAERFVRVHRSTIVNVGYVTEVRSVGHGDEVLVLDDGSEVRVSRRYRERLNGLLDA